MAGMHVRGRPPAPATARLAGQGVQREGTPDRALARG